MSFSLLNLKTYPYTYVPPCPHCGNKATGHIISPRSDAQDDWAIIAALKNGEIVEPRETNRDNCFCPKCGFTWKEELKTSLLSHKELVEQKKMRNTESILANYTMYKEEAPEKKQHFKRIRKFIGRI